MAERAVSSTPFSAERWVNRWDLLVMPLVIGGFFLLGWAATRMTAPYEFGAPIRISLNPWNLPGYAVRTTLRMFVALGCSFAFTLIYGNIAAKSRRAEKILIPLLDILQSVPILGFLSVTVVWFVHLFPGHVAGAEVAAIFAIFTSQAWNMTFSFYYSLRLLPKDLRHAAAVFQLSSWRRFWKVEVPFAMPGLVWNTMMSVSGGWFFVVASEAITVSNRTVLLPGIGSYIAVAIQQRDLLAIGWAILVMLIVILLYDQLIFRPLVAWSEKFKYEFARTGPIPESWMLNLLQRSQLIKSFGLLLRAVAGWISTQAGRLRHSRASVQAPVRKGPEWTRQRLGEIIWSTLLVATSGAVIVLLGRYVLREVRLTEIATAFLLGFYTLLRVIALTMLASCIWVPIGVYIGLRPRLAQKLQPVALFLAAFPANLLFPLAVFAIVRLSLDPEIWLSPLMILGTQWYILFNVIGGTRGIPGDLREAAANLGLRGWTLWRRVYLPAIFPAYLTGGLTASGGAWNASVVAEVVSWGSQTVSAHGIGAYIAAQTVAGDHPRVALGIAVMSLYVLLFNRLVWKRLYAFAQQRLTLE